MAIQGKISAWDHQKGYGYIAVDDQEAQVKFDLFDFEAFGHPPRLSDRVQFRLAQDEQGDFKAVHVERQFVFSFSLAVAIWFVTTMVASVFVLNFPPVLLVASIAMSTITYLVYAVDKQSKHSGSKPMSNTVFYLLNILGGWPGALLAQSILHHKYRDVDFRLFFWVTAASNGGFYCWTLTYEGSLVINSVIEKLPQLMTLS